MSKYILILFTFLTLGSLALTYQGIGLQGVKSYSTGKQIRSSHAGGWIGSSGGGYSSGK